MTFKLAIIVFSFFVGGLVGAQESPPVPDPNATQNGQPTAAPSPSAAVAPRQGAEELLDGTGLVINKNVFSYDGNEGRDPFKIYREFIQPGTTQGNSGLTNVQLNGNGKNIRNVVVPDDIVVQGILFSKKDPIALVMIKGVKGLNKLKLNSPIGRNEGKVVDIQRGKIVIEQVKDFDGQKFTDKVELEVREDRARKK